MRPKTPAVAPLEPDVVAVLLGGWLAEPPGGQKKIGFTAQTYDMFSGDLPRVAELWRQHESYLRAEAARWRIEPEYELPRGRLGFSGNGPFMKSRPARDGDGTDARTGRGAR